MFFTHIPAKNYKTTTWSGGTTTELFIYPATANYQQCDFDFRISTAKVEVEQSDFTLLPGYSRKLMVLDGAVTLQHEGHHIQHLGKFEVDDFQGDCKTTSVGKCIDFNLMTKPGIAGSISGISLKKGQVESVDVKENTSWFFIYLFSGSVEIAINHKIVFVNIGDFVVFENLANRRILLNARKNSEVVFTEVR